MKSIKEYFRGESMQGRMGSLLEKAKARKKTTFAIIAALIMVGSVGLYVVYIHSNELQNGVPVNLSVKFTGAPPGVSPFAMVSKNATKYYNDENVFFSLLSVIPMNLNTTPEGKFVNMTGLNMTNNPYDVSVLSGRLSSSGQYSGILGNNFYNIARQWRASGISKSSDVSVMLQAGYSFVINGTIYEYRYYNNVQYSPFSGVFNDMKTFVTNPNSPSISLQSHIFFNLSHPSYVGPFNLSDFYGMHVAKIQTGGILGPPGSVCDPHCIPNCGNNGIAQPLGGKSWTGPLPLAISTQQLPSNSSIETSFADLSSASGMSFNTAEACQVDSVSTQVMDSTTGSFSSGSITSVSGNLASSHTTGDNMSMVYLPSVTFTAYEYHDVYPQLEYIDGKWYCGAYYGAPYTVMSITSMSNNIAEEETLYSQANLGSNTYQTTAADWSAVLNSLGMVKVDSGTINAGQSLPSFEYSNYVTEYNNAKSEMAQVNNAMGTFTAALGVALAINAATGIIPGAADAEDVVSGISLASSEVGLASAIISDMSSISIYTSSTVHFSEFTISNDKVDDGGTIGSNVAYTIYQSAGSTPIFFVDNSNYNTYSFNAPMDYFSYVPVS